MNEEVKQINSEIKEYQSKIKELEEKKQTILASDLKIGRFVKILDPECKNYVCVDSVACFDEGIPDTRLVGLVIYKPLGGDYIVISGDAKYVNRNDIIDITKEEFEEVLDKAINNFKSIIQ